MPRYLLIRNQILGRVEIRIIADNGQIIAPDPMLRYELVGSNTFNPQDPYILFVVEKDIRQPMFTSRVFKAANPYGFNLSYKDGTLTKAYELTAQNGNNRIDTALSPPHATELLMVWPNEQYNFDSSDLQVWIKTCVTNAMMSGYLKTIVESQVKSNRSVDLRGFSEYLQGNLPKEHIVDWRINPTQFSSATEDLKVTVSEAANNTSPANGNGSLLPAWTATVTSPARAKQASTQQSLREAFLNAFVQRLEPGNGAELHEGGFVMQYADLQAFIDKVRDGYNQHNFSQEHAILYSKIEKLFNKSIVSIDVLLQGLVYIKGLKCDSQLKIMLLNCLVSAMIKLDVAAEARESITATMLANDLDTIIFEFTYPAYTLGLRMFFDKLVVDSEISKTDDKFVTKDQKGQYKHPNTISSRMMRRKRKKSQLTTREMYVHESTTFTVGETNKSSASIEVDIYTKIEMLIGERKFSAAHSILLRNSLKDEQYLQLLMYALLKHAEYNKNKVFIDGLIFKCTEFTAIDEHGNNIMDVWVDKYNPSSDAAFQMFKALYDRFVACSANAIRQKGISIQALIEYLSPNNSGSFLQTLLLKVGDDPTQVGRYVTYMIQKSVDRAPNNDCDIRTERTQLFCALCLSRDRNGNNLLLNLENIMMSRLLSKKDREELRLLMLVIESLYISVANDLFSATSDEELNAKYNFYGENIINVLNFVKIDIHSNALNFSSADRLNQMLLQMANEPLSKHRHLQFVQDFALVTRVRMSMYMDIHAQDGYTGLVVESYLHHVARFMIVLARREANDPNKPTLRTFVTNMLACVEFTVPNPRHALIEYMCNNLDLAPADFDLFVGMLEFMTNLEHSEIKVFECKNPTVPVAEIQQQNMHFCLGTSLRLLVLAAVNPEFKCERIWILLEEFIDRYQFKLEAKGGNVLHMLFYLIHQEIDVLQENGQTIPEHRITELQNIFARLVEILERQKPGLFATLLKTRNSSDKTPTQELDDASVRDLFDAQCLELLRLKSALRLGA